MIEKLFSETTVVNANAAKKFIKFYAREHNWHNLDLSTGNLGYGWIHYAMIRTIKPKRILCIGSLSGFIPAICALACKDNRQGYVDFIDAGYDEKEPSEPDNWGGVGLWKRVDPKKYFKRFGLSDYIKLHVTTTQDFRINDSRWGYMYIDGDHSYKGAKHDYAKFWPALERGGAMAFHDIYVKRMGTLVFGVYRLWREIKQTHLHSTIEYPGDFGLGIVMKASEKLKLLDEAS